jgi:hypothetical protein
MVTNIKKTMDTEVILKLKEISKQLQKIIDGDGEVVAVKKQLQQKEEVDFVKDLLKHDYVITDNDSDYVPCAELCRYLTLKSDKYSPRKFDYVLARIFKTITKKQGATNTKYKVGIKRLECLIE